MTANILTAIANRAMEWGSGLLEFVPGLRLCVDIQNWIILCACATANVTRAAASCRSAHFQ